ncbi:MAG: hypothetical protein COA66_10340 [Arcobacter sp.]|nr:MAG: hypothetical protein COA66_10340 [Arcobacter sp.]
MEIVLGIATILGGITAVWFFIDKFLESKRQRKVIMPTNTKNHVVVNRPRNTSQVFGATESGRHPFFINEPQDDISSAIKLAGKNDKMVFVVIYDDNHPTKSKLFYSLGCFMDYFTTKKLVEDHFIPAIVNSSSKMVIQYIPEDDPLENARLVLLLKSGEILLSEGVYANPDEGLKRIRNVIAQNV